MAFVPAVNCAHVRLEGVIDGQQTINDLYFRNSAAISVADIAGLAVNIRDWFDLTFSTICDASWTTVAVHARDLTTAFGVVSDLAAAGTIGGTAGEGAPNNVAACISFRTGLAGRSFRGRNYIPAVPNSQIDLNTFETEYIAACIAVYSDFLPGGAVLPAGWEWVILSRFSGVGPGGVPIPRITGVMTPVLSVLFTDFTADSMRSRLPGRGK